MRLRRILRPRSWAYALGELLLIVVGILIALAIDNWDEVRHERAIEVETLRELEQGLASDAERVRHFIQQFQESQRSAQIILAHMKNDVPYHDSLATHLGGLMVGTTFTPNTAPYETLQSQGLRTITNDSLRLAVAYLYDVNYEYLSRLDRMLTRQFEQILQPAYVGRFHNISFSSAEPLDAGNLLHDHDFRGVVEFAHFYREFIVPQYEAAAQDIERLRSDIGREVTRLE